MDNLPKDPPDENKTSASPAGGPPPFGASFNPHTNPVDPDNPYQTSVTPPPPQNPVSSVPNPPASPTQRGEPNSPDGPEEIKHDNYSEVAQSKPRDEHGRFKSESSQAPLIPEHPDQNPTPPTSQPAPTAPNPSPLPPPITITENTKYSEKKDPPLFNFNASFTNPVTYFKNWVARFLKNQDIDLRLRIKPFATIGLIIAFGIVGGTTFSIGRYLFPNSSPILHRQVVYPGIVQKGADGQYFLMSADSTLWKLKPKINNIKLSDLVDKKVVVTGNLTSERNLIEVSEVIVSETNPQPLTPIPTSTPTPDIPDQDLLPKLYSNITWETNQKKILTFTSGRRRIEQEGVYLESAQVSNLPQDFINYYTQELKAKGFKETLNSTDPDGTMVTYSKDELFLTFGVKNVYSGSGDNKKITGYRAYIEHN